MNFADLFKKNIIFIPVVASIVVGSFTGIKYVLNLTTTINQSEQQIVNLEKDLSIALGKTNRIPLTLATWMPIIIVGIFSSIGILQINEK